MTTTAKAKELRPLAEKMVTLARTGTLANRRRVQRMVRDRKVLARLFDEIAPRFADRPGGYTRVIPLGSRHGDHADMSLIEFVDYELDTGEGSAEKGKKSFVDRARGMFGAGAKGGEAEAEAEAAEQRAGEAGDAAEETAPKVEEAEPETEEPEEKTEAEAPAEEQAEEPVEEDAEEKVEAAEDEETKKDE